MEEKKEEENKKKKMMMIMIFIELSRSPASGAPLRLTRGCRGGIPCPLNAVISVK
jgi:hypothetical protein